MPKLIGIAGPSCSGKSSLTEQLESSFKDMEFISLDSYWKDSNNFKKVWWPFGKLFGCKNWELPQNLKLDDLYDNLFELKQGYETKIPICNDADYQKMYRIASPKSRIIVEGFLLFYDKSIRDIFDTKIYLDLPDEEIIKRRLERNKSNKPDRESYYRKVVVNEYKKYGLPGKQYADLILDGTKPLEDNLNKILLNL